MTDNTRQFGYSVAYKHPKRNKLFWVWQPGITDPTLAGKLAREIMLRDYPDVLARGYIEYGISKTWQ